MNTDTRTIDTRTIAMSLGAIAPLLTTHYSLFDVWEALTPAQRAMIDDISPQMDEAMALQSGASKSAILEMIARHPVEVQP